MKIQTYTEPSVWSESSILEPSKILNKEKKFESIKNFQICQIVLENYKFQKTQNLKSTKPLENN